MNRSVRSSLITHTFPYYYTPSTHALRRVNMLPDSSKTKNKPALSFVYLIILITKCSLLFESYRFFEYPKLSHPFIHSGMLSVERKCDWVNTEISTGFLFHQQRCCSIADSFCWPEMLKVVVVAYWLFKLRRKSIYKNNYNNNNKMRRQYCVSENKDVYKVLRTV